MVHGPATLIARVHHHAVAFREAFLASYLRRSPHQMTEESSMSNASLGERSNVFARNDDDVHRRLGVDIGECVRELVLVHGR
jgi:hypothetical protein